MGKISRCAAAVDVAQRWGRKLAEFRGQSTTEYIILVIVVSLVSLPIMRMLPDAVRGYVKPFYYCLSRPIP